MALRWIFGLATAALAAAGAAVGAEAPARVLHVRTVFNEQVAEQLAHADWPNIDRVQVSSPGGDPIAALKVARTLKASGKPIEVSELCASSCLYILAIDRGVRIAPGTLVLLHNMPSSTQAMTRKVLPRVSARYQAISQSEVAWLRENHVNPNILLVPNLMIAPTCVGGVGADDPALFRSVKYGAKYEFWAPPAAVKTSYGLHASGEWLDSREAAAAAKVRATGTVHGLSTAPDSPALRDASFGDLARQLEVSAKCPA